MKIEKYVRHGRIELGRSWMWRARYALCESMMYYGYLNGEQEKRADNPTVRKPVTDCHKVTGDQVRERALLIF